MEIMICKNCEYFESKFLLWNKCKKHKHMLSNYEACNYTCNEWTPNMTTKSNFREIKRDDGCK